jgi:plasmid stabilization system protein ParE
MPKTFTVLILPSAQEDLDAIHAYVSADSRGAANRVTAALLDAAASLSTFPLRHRVIHRRAFGRRARSMVCLSYRIIYTVRGSAVIVLRMFHAARRLPRRII